MSSRSSAQTVPPPAPLSRTLIEKPPADAAAVAEIAARGNVALLVGDTILAEIANTELREGLAATGALSQTELISISSALAERISEAVTAGCSGSDMAEVAADAAALFVLCLRRSNLLDVDNIPACSVSFSDDGSDAKLILAE